MFRSGASSLNAIVICTPLCSVRISGVWFFCISDLVFMLSMTHFLPYLIYMFKPIRKGWQSGGVGILFSLYQRNQSHSREFPSRKILPYVNPWFKNLNLTAYAVFFFGLPYMSGFFRPLALNIFQSHKGSHIQTAGAIKFVWFFHFEVFNLRFDFWKIMLPHDRFKLSTLVHLEGPLTLLLATVICISLKCDARAVAGGESHLSALNKCSHRRSVAIWFFWSW